MAFTQKMKLTFDTELIYMKLIPEIKEMYLNVNKELFHNEIDVNTYLKRLNEIKLVLEEYGWNLDQIGAIFSRWSKDVILVVK